MGRTAVRSSAGPIAAVFLLTLVVYVPALSAGFVWDDDAYVTENTLLRSTEGLARIWTTLETPQYYPLVFTTFWVEYQLWGLAPLGYHLVNVILHALNAILVGLILRRLAVPGAWWAAALFAVHPVHVESVAWVTERKNVLSGLFYLSAFATYLRFHATGRRALHGLSLLLFVAALLSKTVTSSLPVILAGWLWFRHGRLTRRDGWRLAPFLAIALAMGSVTVYLEKHMVGAVAYDFDLSWLDRLRIAARGLLFYPSKLLVPQPLIFNYPRWDLTAFGPADVLAPLALAALAGGLFLLWRRGVPGPALGAAFFAVTLFPALGLFDVYPFRYSFVADHFQYLASLGVLVVLVDSARRLSGRLGVKPGAGRTVAVVVMLALAVLTWRQCRAYASAETLWVDTLAKNPGSWLAHNNLAMIRKDRGELEAALGNLNEALRANPRSTESHTGRGLVLSELGRTQEALEDFDTALRLDPSYAMAYLHRGRLFEKLGRHQEVLDDFAAVLQSRPDYLPAYQARGRALAALGRLGEAVAAFGRAIELGANFEAYNDRGTARLRMGDYRAALEDFDRALEERPQATYIRHNRGAARSQLGDVRGALADFDAVLAADPAAANTYRLRGMLVLRALGDRPRACGDWRRACELGQCTEFEAHCSGQP